MNLLDLKNRRVDLTILDDFGILISTVYIGTELLDANDYIFETMVFTDSSDSSLNEYRRQYSTLKDAKIGHKKIVTAVKRLLRMRSFHNRTIKRNVIDGKI